MKKIIYISLLSMLGLYANAQVGINTKEPKATLDIKKYSSETNFRIASGTANSNDLFKVTDNGYLRLGNATSISGINNNYKIGVKSLHEGKPVFAIVDRENSNAYLKHYIKYNTTNTYQELEDIGIPKNRMGHFFVFSTPNGDSGFYIGAVTEQASGLYIGEDGKNGIGLTDKPTETLDINGTITIGQTTASSDYQNAPNGGSCTKPGEIIFYNNSFYGCGGDSTWKKLNNN